MGTAATLVGVLGASPAGVNSLGGEPTLWVVLGNSLWVLVSLLHGRVAEGERIGVRGPALMELAAGAEEGVVEEGTGPEAPPETYGAGPGMV